MKRKKIFVSYGTLFIIFLNLIFVLAEISIGFTINSMSLTTDALHNGIDVLSLIFSAFALFLINKKPTEEHTYGFYNVSIMSAFFNSFLLICGLIVIIVNSLIRLFSQNYGISSASGDTISFLSFISIIVNGITALVLKNRKELNGKSNFWHFFSDVLISAIVLVSGLIIAFSGISLLDPLSSIFASSLVIFKTRNIFFKSYRLITNGVPKKINTKKVENYLLSFPCIDKINDFHIWPLSTTEIALSAHLETKNLKDYTSLIDRATKGLRNKFGIDHVTIQLETYNKSHQESKI